MKHSILNATVTVLFGLVVFALTSVQASGSVRRALQIEDEGTDDATLAEVVRPWYYNLTDGILSHYRTSDSTCTDIVDKDEERLCVLYSGYDCANGPQDVCIEIVEEIYKEFDPLPLAEWPAWTDPLTNQESPTDVCADDDNEKTCTLLFTSGCAASPLQWLLPSCTNLIQKSLKILKKKKKAGSDTFASVLSDHPCNLEDKDKQKLCLQYQEANCGVDGDDSTKDCQKILAKVEDEYGVGVTPDWMFPYLGSMSPSSTPSDAPSATPTSEPSAEPSSAPTGIPSATPTSEPSAGPSSAPTGIPSATPTSEPSAMPSSSPSDTPTLSPSFAPTISHVPSASPSSQPSSEPSRPPPLRLAFLDDGFQISSSGDSQSQGGLTLTNGKVLLIPNGGSEIVIFDPETDSFETIDVSSYLAGLGYPRLMGFKWAAIAGNGKVVLVQGHRRTTDCGPKIVGVFDPIDNSLELVDIDPTQTTDCYWHFGGAATAPDGNVVFAPGRKQLSVVGVFDASDNSYKSIDISSQLIRGDPTSQYDLQNSFAFQGAVTAPNGKIVFVPSDVGSVGVFNPDNNTFELVDIDMSLIGIPGLSRYNGGVALPNGKIVFAPYHATSVGVFNPDDNSFEAVDFSGAFRWPSRHFSGAIFTEGKVVFAPHREPSVGIFDPMSNSFESIYIGNTDGLILIPGLFSSASIGGNGDIVFVASEFWNGVGVFNTNYLLY